MSTYNQGLWESFALITMNVPLLYIGLPLGNFRSDYKYDIEYEYNSSVVVYML